MNPEKNRHAPVALFVYDRLDCVRITMKYLLANTLARETDLYVFSDGGREEISWALVQDVRLYLHQVQRTVEATRALRSLTVVEHPENLGAARNMQEGIAYVLERHDRIVVLEDDLMTSPYFLEFMNQALAIYKDVGRVRQVSGFSYLDLKDATTQDFYFSSYASAWGWGTWKDRWEDSTQMRWGDSERPKGEDSERPKGEDSERLAGKGLKQLEGGGLCLMPAHTLVRNVGWVRRARLWASSGRPRGVDDRWPLFRSLTVTWVEEPRTDEDVERRMQEVAGRGGSDHTLLSKVLGAPRLWWRRLKRK